jgi:TPR repeat protein
VSLGALLEDEGHAEPATAYYEHGVQRLIAACEQDDPVACSALGWAHAEGRGVPTDRARAAELYGRACAANDPVACVRGGDLARNEDGFATPATARGYTQACDAGYYYACVQVGLEYLVGEAIPADTERGLQHLRAACEGGEPHGCATLGTAYASGVGVSPDLTRAHELYNRACNEGDAYACGSLGILLTRGAGVERDLAGAADLFERACKEDDPIACGNLGWMHVRGLGGRDDADAGRKLLEDACQREDPRSCYRLGVTLDGEPGSRVQAADLYRNACELGDADSCSALAVSYVDGRVAGGDERLATDLATYACNAGSGMGCVLMGQMLYHGFGEAAKDRAQAERFFRAGCELGDVHGCEILARWATNDAEGGAAEQYWSAGLDLRIDACDGGSVGDCVVLGVYYVRGLGTGRDFSRAVDLYERGCEEGIRSSCTYLGQVLITGSGVPAEPVRAADLFTDACEAGDEIACAWMGLAYHQGRGRAVDHARARELYARGCDTGIGFGCVGLAVMTEHGEGGPADPVAAAELRRRACSLGEKKYCAAPPATPAP